jgi:transketolase
VDGHDVAALGNTLGGVSFEPGKPSVVIARTVKGKGVSFMENEAKWHHGVPSDQQYEQALRELEGMLAEVKP